MSRNILQRQIPHMESLVPSTNGGKLLFTTYEGKQAAFLVKENRLLWTSVVEENASKVGAIYIGKVKNVVKNIDACFVEISDGELCFLPLKDCKNPIICNRDFDGRVLQGDEILVQVVRDSMKTKQAALTTEISLQNEYFVFQLGIKESGLSKQFSKEEKTRITSWLEVHKLSCNESFGFIVRTKAILLSEDDFINEFFKLKVEFEKILTSGMHRTCYTCLKASNSPYLKVLNQLRINDYDEIITDLKGIYASLKDGHINIRLYEDEEFSLSKLYGIESKMEEALSKKVWLKSGANLIIEPLETLTAIDVNSSKCDLKNANEETIYKINLEAAKEVALQIRLRNLSGIILVDFINMNDSGMEEKLLKAMDEFVKQDKVFTKVVDMTKLGLVEITRKKINQNIYEQFSNKK